MQLVKANRDALLKPLQVVSGIVERRQTLADPCKHPGAQGGRQSVVHGDRSGNPDPDQRDDRRPVLKPPQRPLRPASWSIFCGRFPTPTFSCRLTNKKMAVASGKSRFNLQTLAAEEFPTVAQAEFTADFSLPAATLKYLLGMVHFAMAQQDIRYYLNGMLLVVDGTTVRAVATDGHRLALAEVTKADAHRANARSKRSCRARRFSSLSRLLPDNDDPVRVQMAANQAKFSFGDIELISKLVEGKFPDYQRVVPAANTKVFAINREDLMHALQRAAILTTDKFKGVRMLLAVGSSEDQLDQRRPGRRAGRIRDRLRGRPS